MPLNGIENEQRTYRNEQMPYKPDLMVQKELRMTAIVAKDFNYVKIDNILVRDDKHREVRKGTDAWNDFVDSIREYGVIQPITLSVNKDQKGTFKLVTGLHSLRGAEEAGLKVIPAVCIDVNDDEMNFIQIQENLHRRQDTPSEFGRTVRRLMANPKYQNLSKEQWLKKLAMKKSTSWFDSQMALNNLIPEVSTKVDAGEIAISKAYQLAKLPAELQIEWMEKAESMNANEFQVATDAVVADLKKAKSGDKREADPLRAAVRRGVKEFKLEIGRLEELLAASPEDKYLKGRYDMLMWSIKLDPETLALEDAEKKQKEKARTEFIKRRKAYIEADTLARDKKLKEDGFLPDGTRSETTEAPMK